MKDNAQINEIFNAIPVDLERAATREDKGKKEFEKAGELINYFLENLLNGLPDWAISVSGDLSEKSVFFAPGSYTLMISYNNKAIRLGAIKCSKTVDSDYYILTQITCYLNDLSKPEGMVQDNVDIANANRVCVIFKPYGTLSINITLIDAFVKALRIYMQTGNYIPEEIITAESLGL